MPSSPVRGPPGLTLGGEGDGDHCNPANLHPKGLKVPLRLAVVSVLLPHKESRPSFANIISFRVRALTLHQPFLVQLVP